MKEAIEILKAWEKWEAGFIFDNKCWKNGLPNFTQEQMDKYNLIQEQRNNFLKGEK